MNCQKHAFKGWGCHVLQTVCPVTNTTYSRALCAQFKLNVQPLEGNGLDGWAASQRAASRAPSCMIDGSAAGQVSWQLI